MSDNSAMHWLTLKFKDIDTENHFYNRYKHELRKNASLTIFAVIFGWSIPVIFDIQRSVENGTPFRLKYLSLIKNLIMIMHWLLSFKWADLMPYYAPLQSFLHIMFIFESWLL